MTQSIETIADITIPDSALAREITEFIRDAEDDLLFDHSRRVFLFGALQGRRRGLQPDLELLYAGAMFHDLGLTQRYRSSALRFEVDGANAARDFLLQRGVGERDLAHRVATDGTRLAGAAVPREVGLLLALELARR